MAEDHLSESSPRLARGLSRRDFLPAAALAATAGCAANQAAQMYAGPRSAVFAARASSYRADLAAILEAGIRACGLRVKDKAVLLKPNLVEFDASTSINTNAAVLAAAFEVFTRLGAASVMIGEGPGHRRDTVYLARQAGYTKTAPQFENRFIDLNRDDVAAVKDFCGLPEIYLPKTALGADIIVSLAKMKTHHWAGATLSMKNFFGLVPGAVYGWPKNVLHQQGVSESIVALNKIFRKTFAIVDGIVGMEGNGPIQGTPKTAGVLVMGADLVAVDATCCRIMGIEPARLAFLEQSAALGHLLEAGIEQRGETVSSLLTPFHVAPGFEQARKA